MKNVIAILFLAFGALTAHAADTCKTEVKYVHAGKVGADWWSYWFCVDDGTWQWAILSPGTFTREGIERSTARYLGLNVPAIPGVLPSEDVIGQMRVVVEAAVAADTVRPPAPPVAKWVVGKTGNPDRPTYPATNGVRSTKSDGRATVGATCDCTQAIVEGKTTYCPVAKTAIGSALSTSVGLVPPVVTPPIITPPVVTPPVVTPPAPAPKTISVTVCTKVTP